MKKILVFLLLIIILFLYFSTDKMAKNKVEIKEVISVKKVKIEKRFEKSYEEKKWDYIYFLAEKRGYEKHEEEKELSNFKYKNISREIKSDLEKLFLLAKKEKIRINLISAFRSVAHQKKIFENKLKKVCDGEDILNGGCDEKINKILEVSSPSNYSKHHTGKALDFSCGNNFSLSDNFRKTKCYKWLSKNNFEISKKYNFYASYPDDKFNQGPNPEPWEFIWKK